MTPSQLMKCLEHENIEARPVWNPLHLQPVFKGYSYFAHSEKDSVADRLFATGLCLPSGTNMNEDEQKRMIACAQKTLRG